MAVDPFAEIAGRQRAAPRASLVEPAPPDLPDITLPWTASARAFQPQPKMSTEAELQAELARMRQRYAPFLADLAPALPSTRIVLPVRDFDWQLAEDATHYALRNPQWTRVTLPHYGPPIGRATAFYRTTFQVTDEMRARGALLVRFRGVDYKAHVFVNDVYLGSHEGFFAPFEFDFTPIARLGENELLVRVENDAVCMGNDTWGQKIDGDKLYAATGPGWDDPELGWHHCPPGMGIYQPVSLEARAPLYIHDLWVRPLLAEERAELWLEVYNTTGRPQTVALRYAIYGQNFEETVVEGQTHQPRQALGPGINTLRLAVPIPHPRVWELEAPWLYQAQIRLLDERGETLDAVAHSFGMRSFWMTGEPGLDPAGGSALDAQHRPEPQTQNGETDQLATSIFQLPDNGRFYLNGREIRLRGANTMGFEQQDVMTGNLDQLADDILLAKICHMNFWRLTQRPVQDEVYAMCDRLGLLTQTDLPLFGYLRRNQFAEAVRQAEEMERLVRSHPCNVLVSYINEPFPYEWGDKTHRHLTRGELEAFFVAADQAVRLANPDRVIKAVDGDYDPPGPGLPDNHCYTLWYNGHSIDAGALHRGHWQRVKPGWRYGCGEFGAEGLDPADLMRRRYPAAWLPHSPEEAATWSPSQIVKAQTGDYHYCFFDTPHTVEEWVTASQAHQAWATRLMTEAFRRDGRMSSFAIHLFIDAWPAGWMKAIMDCERRPKPAYFAYREALTPLMANLRTDRWRFWAGEMVSLEAWICNDLADAPEGAVLRYGVEGLEFQFEADKPGLLKQTVSLAASRLEPTSDLSLGIHSQSPAHIPPCASAFQGYVRFPAPEVAERSTLTVRLGLLDAAGRVLHDTAMELETFPRPDPSPGPKTCVIGRDDGPAARLATELGLTAAPLADAQVLLIDDLDNFSARKADILAAIERSATAVFLELSPGEYTIAGETIRIAPCGMGPRHFVSRATGHPLVEGFRPDDFKFWYDPALGRVAPLLETTFTADGWRAILTTGNGDWGIAWQPTLAAAERPLGAGRLRICQVKLAGRIATNPIATLFARRLLER